MAAPRKKTAKRNKAFIEKATKTVGNQFDAMKALDSADVREVRKLASKWGITVTEAEARQMIGDFENVLGKPPGDDTIKIC